MFVGIYFDRNSECNLILRNNNFNSYFNLNLCLHKLYYTFHTDVDKNVNIYDNYTFISIWWILICVSNQLNFFGQIFRIFVFLLLLIKQFIITKYYLKYFIGSIPFRVTCIQIRIIFRQKSENKSDWIWTDKYLFNVFLRYVS